MRKEDLNDLLRLAYLQLLVFPLLVAIVTAVALLCGGRCSAWQWWTSVVVVACAAWRMRASNLRMVSAVLWCGCMAVLWGACSVAWISCLGEDMPEYHYPAIRLLIEGWNPIWQSTPQQLADFMKPLGLTGDMFRSTHLVFMPKTLWCLCAVAYAFSGNSYCLFAPVIMLILPVACWRIWMSLSRYSVWLRCAALGVFLLFLPSPFHMIDMVVAMAGVALIMTMYSAIRYNEWDWLSLFVFSCWMCVAKQTGCVSCFVLWSCFAFWHLCSARRRQRIAQIALLGLGMLVVFVLTNISPYVTSSIHYHHPLYPTYTSDAVRYPADNGIAAAFLDRNADADQLGHVGMFVSSFFSTELAHAFYKWKLGVPEFQPNCGVWEIVGGNGSQTNVKYRVLIVLSLLLTLWLGCGCLRVFALVAYFALGIMPTETVGYLRYVPWWCVLPVLAMMAVAEWQRYLRLKYVVLAGFVFGFCLVFSNVMKQSFIYWQGEIIRMVRARKTIQLNPPAEVFVYYPSYWSDDTNKRGDQRFKSRFDDNEANLRLLVRQTAELRDAQISSLPPHLHEQADLDANFKPFMGDPIFRIASVSTGNGK